MMTVNARIPEGAATYCAAAAHRAEQLIATFPPDLRTLPKLLVHQAARFGGRTLFKAGDRAFTYAQAPELAARWAGALAGCGLEKGDRIAIMCGNRMEFMELALGCAWLGAAIVPINIASRGFQLQHILSNSGAKFLFVDSEALASLETLDRSELPLEHVFLIGAEEAVPQPGVSAAPPIGQAVPAADVAMSDTIAILYTSGTTGVSKGVCCPHGQFFWWGIYTARLLGLREGDVLNTALPLFHTNAFNCFFQALLNGATQVVEQRFSVSKFWERLDRSGANVTYLLGAMVPMLLSRPPSREESKHNVRVALAPGVPGHCHREFTERTGIILIDGFGSTESNAVIGTELTMLNPGKMGKVAAGFQARVVDDHDCDVPDGEAGELILRADEPFAFASGYHGMPDKTVESWRNLWLHTGDRVVRTADGYLQFIDRMKDVIRRRGENISSFEVEQVVQSHPAVAIAASFPVSSELAEDEVMVSLILHENTSLDPVELIRYCETRMPYFSVPRFIDMVKELPRTANGKIQKFKLRDLGVTGTTWDREVAGIEIKR